MADNWNTTSDARLKTSIAPIRGALAKLLSVQGVSYESKEKPGKKKIGVTAQDIEKVFPEIVNSADETGMKSVSYGRLVAPIIEAIKEQQQLLEAQRKENAALQARIEQLEKSPLAFAAPNNALKLSMANN